jgi:carbon-monoxide dehydrogenase medium subunit
MTLPPFEYRTPESPAQVVELLVEYGDDALLVAGGTAVVNLLRERLVRPQVLISLVDIAELQGININGACEIGAVASLREIERSDAVHSFAPLLSEACARVGSVAIRNMATLGGNVTHGDATSDPVPALIALGAEAVLLGPEGERTVPLDGFFVSVFTTDIKEQEFLTGLKVPRPDTQARTKFTKYTCTSVEAFAAVTVAALYLPAANGTCADLRIGLGGVAATPLRATAAEDVLRGKEATADRIAEAAEAAAVATDPSPDGQGSAAYKRDMTRVWVRRALEEICLP